MLASECLSTLDPWPKPTWGWHGAPDGRWNPGNRRSLRITRDSTVQCSNHWNPSPGTTYLFGILFNCG